MGLRPQFADADNERLRTGPSKPLTPRLWKSSVFVSTTDGVELLYWYSATSGAKTRIRPMVTQSVIKPLCSNGIFGLSPVLLNASLD